jgi:hypothetical protein
VPFLRLSVASFKEDNLGPCAGAPACARTFGSRWGASGELPPGADLNPGRRPASVDSGGVCAVVRGIQGTREDQFK